MPSPPRVERARRALSEKVTRVEEPFKEADDETATKLTEVLEELRALRKEVAARRAGGST